MVILGQDLSRFRHCNIIWKLENEQSHVLWFLYRIVAFRVEQLDLCFFFSVSSMEQNETGSKKKKLESNNNNNSNNNNRNETE